MFSAESPETRYKRFTNDGPSQGLRISQGKQTRHSRSLKSRMTRPDSAVGAAGFGCIWRFAGAVTPGEKGDSCSCSMRLAVQSRLFYAASGSLQIHTPARIDGATPEMRQICYVNHHMAHWANFRQRALENMPPWTGMLFVAWHASGSLFGSETGIIRRPGTTIESFRLVGQWELVCPKLLEESNPWRWAKMTSTSCVTRLGVTRFSR